MNSFVGFLVGILQSALSLLGLVQQHPELPPAARQEAADVATQAITKAADAIKDADTFRITFPQTTVILPADQKTKVTWSIPDSVLKQFPSDFNVFLFLYIEDEKGMTAGGIGDGQDASAKSAQWDIPLSVKTGQLKPGGKYKIVAQLQAQPKDTKRLCAVAKNKDCSPSEADAAIMAKAQPYKSETGFFTIGSTAPGASNLKTYTNAEYGFSIQYPADLSVDTSPSQWDDQIRIVRIGGVSVSISPNTAECVLQGLNPGSETINGTLFLTTEIDEPATGLLGLGRNFIAVHNGLCFRIEAVHVGGAPGHYEGAEREKVEAANAAGLKEVLSIARTFRFSGNSSETPVTGMQKYTDTDFGFSFWYPVGWKVTVAGPPSKSPDYYYPGGILQKGYQLKDSVGAFAVALNLVYSADRTITDTGGAGPFGPIRYYFDVDSHTWMSECTEGCPNGSAPIKAADVSINTMGGLHMLSGTSRFDTNIIPLSAHNFVVIMDGGGPNATYLARTIVALDPAVATPISAAGQKMTIESEKNAYAGF